MGGVIYVGDVGTEIRLDIGQEGATNASIEWMKPGGITGSWPAIVHGTEVTYRVEEGDLDVPGAYRLQAKAELHGGWRGLGETAVIHISPRFK